MANVSRMQKWLEIVDRDIDAAEWMQQGGRWLYVAFECHQAFIEQMSPMYIAARYPEHKQRIALALNEETCHSIVEQTKQFKQWILQEYSALKKSSNSSDATSN